MEEDKGGAGTSSRVSSSIPPSAPSPPPPPPPPSPSAKDAPAAPAKRQMFPVELKPGETTIVSWKKLLREAGKGSVSGYGPRDSGVAVPTNPGSASGPAPDAIQPLEGEIQEAQPSNRFNAVIEKIERLYMGKQSSDEEELDDIPDDDQYDTEDSFIDDAELDEYFQVDKLSTKHNGYFVNKGKLERIEPSSSPSLAPKKGRGNDLAKVHAQANDGHVSSDAVSTGNVRIKAAARSAPFTERKLSGPAKIPIAYGEHYQEGKILKNKTYGPRGPYKKRSAESVMKHNSSGRISKDVSPRLLESKELEKHKEGVLLSRDHVHKSRPVNESIDSVHHASRERAASSHADLVPKKALYCDNEPERSAKMRRKEIYDPEGFPNMDYSVGAYPSQAMQSSSPRMKQSSAIRPKGTTLERAIRDLEKIVELCRPPKVDFQEADSASPGIKRRLPREVKQKLAKVARLSANQNKLSKNILIDRLMGIVGHIVQRRTLKRNLRDMVELGLSAKQEKNDRFQQIKQEVDQMIRTRVSLLKSKMTEQRGGSADDFQEVTGSAERRALRKFGMDIALEDKICDLYDLYLEGNNEERSSQSKKLYGELAELWPNGYMDSNGIKDAISRSRERKRSRLYRHKVRDVERIKRKKLAAEARAEGSNLGSRVQYEQVRLATDSNAQVGTLEKVTTNLPISSTSRVLEPATQLSDSGHHNVSKHSDSARESSNTSMVVDIGGKADVKKKLKRKPESDLGETVAHPTKLPMPQGKEKHSSEKSSEDSNICNQPKLNLQLPSPAVPPDQQS